MKRFPPGTTAESITQGRNLSGRTMLVTGCSSGLGLETMRVLALRGARVIGTARTLSKATQACAAVAGDTVPLQCELGEPESIRECASLVAQLAPGALDAIIANAGVMALPELTLLHGIEAQLFTNHVGHFLLIEALRWQLTRKGRIVIVASGAHSRAPRVTFEDLCWDGPYSPWTAYGISKLANILYAKGLAHRLEEGQTANALHPGIIATSLFRHLSEEETSRMRDGLRFETVSEGAATQVFLATHPSVAKSTGAYFVDGAPKRPSRLACDAEMAARLWTATENYAAGL